MRGVKLGAAALAVLVGGCFSASDFDAGGSGGAAGAKSQACAALQAQCLLLTSCQLPQPECDSVVANNVDAACRTFSANLPTCGGAAGGAGGTGGAAGGGAPPGRSVACGSVACPIVCCGSSCAASDEECLGPNGHGTVYECDGPEDCSASQICCQSYGNDVQGTFCGSTADCASSVAATGLGGVVCHTAADCDGVPCTNDICAPSNAAGGSSGSGGMGGSTGGSAGCATPCESDGACCAPSETCVQDSAGLRACAPTCTTNAECPSSAPCCAWLTNDGKTWSGQAACIKNENPNGGSCLCNVASECPGGSCTPANAFYTCEPNDGGLLHGCNQNCASCEDCVIDCNGNHYCAPSNATGCTATCPSGWCIVASPACDNEFESCTDDCMLCNCE